MIWKVLEGKLVRTIVSVLHRKPDESGTYYTVHSQQVAPGDVSGLLFGKIKGVIDADS